VAARQVLQRGRSIPKHGTDTDLAKLWVPVFVVGRRWSSVDCGRFALGQLRPVGHVTLPGPERHLEQTGQGDHLSLTVDSSCGVVFSRTAVEQRDRRVSAWCRVVLARDVRPSLYIDRYVASGVFRISQRGGTQPTLPPLPTPLSPPIPPSSPLQFFPSPTHLPSLPLPSGRAPTPLIRLVGLGSA